MRWISLPLLDNEGWMQYHKLIPYFKEICCDMEEFAMKIYVSAKARGMGTALKPGPSNTSTMPQRSPRPGDEVLVAPEFTGNMWTR